MKQIGLLIVAALLTGGCPAVVAKGQAGLNRVQGKLAHLRVWDGKYPIADTGSSQSFFDLSEIKQPLSKMLSGKQLARMVGKSGHIGFHAIKVRDKFLIIDNCQIHCCTCRFSTLVVNLSDGSMYVFFEDQIGIPSRTRLRWFSSKGKQARFPKELCAVEELRFPTAGCDA